MKRPENNRPFWFPSDENAKTYPPLADSISVDVAGAVHDQVTALEPCACRTLWPYGRAEVFGSLDRAFPDIPGASSDSA